jgi:hypothetical protein
MKRLKNPVVLKDALHNLARVRYRKPKNANGSRARYFHDRLQRTARLKDGGTAQ